MTVVDEVINISLDSGLEAYGSPVPGVNRLLWADESGTIESLDGQLIQFIEHSAVVVHNERIKREPPESTRSTTRDRQFLRSSHT